MPRNLFLSWFLILVCATAQASVYAGAGIPSSVTLTADITSGGLTIPADFVGISDEEDDVITGGYFQNNSFANTSLLNLIRLLGASVNLRFGGIFSDQSVALALTLAIANNVESFRAGIGPGSSITYGVSACANNPSLITTQVGYLVSASGASHFDIQNGNEPPFESCGYNQSQWTAVFNSYQTTVNATYPAVNFSGPDVTNNQLVQSFVNGTSLGLSGMNKVTSHYYTGSGTLPLTAEQLLADPFAQAVSGYNFSQNVSWAGGKLRLIETGTAAGTGLSGLSNAQAASAWFLDMSIILAKQGWSGINPHNCLLACFGSSLPTYFNSFIIANDGGFLPAATFYGLYMMSLIEGRQILTETVAGGNQTNSIAVKGAGGNATFLVVNNSVSFSAKVTPAQNGAWASAKVLIQTADSCYDTVNFKVGGQPIQESGVWTGGYSTINNGDSVIVPSCSSAIIAIQP